MTLTYNPMLAKVKVDPHAKNQGQTVQTGERQQINRWTHIHTHTDATKRIISSATWSTNIISSTLDFSLRPNLSIAIYFTVINPAKDKVSQHHSTAGNQIGKS